MIDISYVQPPFISQFAISASKLKLATEISCVLILQNDNTSS